ncbi:MAG: PHP domain-containing protein [Deltaproteobacteria bacterium]|jgi:predicted metal-dependent phosphoesterase TrpH
MEKYIDLHIHSLYSDGIYRPLDIVAMAAQKGLKAVALADHDSVSGIDEAFAAGEEYGLEIIPAVEFSTSYKEFRDVHLLGYMIDYNDVELKGKLEAFRNHRDNRARAIVAKVNVRLNVENKREISYEDVVAIGQHAVSRLHIARLLVDNGSARSVREAFKRYLLPFDVPKQYFPMEEALAEIKRLNGIAVLAHPQSISNDRRILKSLVKELAQLGLDGIEVFNNLCYSDDMIFFESLASDLGLLITGGSDFHGVEEDVEIGSGCGGLAVAYHWLQEMRRVALERYGERKML